MCSGSEALCQVLPGEQRFRPQQPSERNHIFVVVIIVMLLALISIESLNNKDNKRIIFTAVGLLEKGVPQTQLIRTQIQNSCIFIRGKCKVVPVPLRNTAELDYNFTTLGLSKSGSVYSPQRAGRFTPESTRSVPIL
jgi:hypothetical protein